MNKALFYWTLFLLLGLTACTSTKKTVAKPFTSIKIDTLYMGKISIRAIAADNDTIYYAGSDKKIGFIAPSGNYEKQLSNLPRNVEIRSIALTSKYVYFLSIETPAMLYRYSRDFKQGELVYEESHAKAFYDSMHFWNDDEGIAIGDPTHDCLSIIITRDAGKTWQKIPCSQLPKVIDGEAAFAASNTNIAIKGNSSWVVTGGKQSRVLYSPDKGTTWQVYNTPMVQGEAMTGIFTTDFYNEQIGFIAGGNYEQPNQNYQNKAITLDGGKTWTLVGEKVGFGYASCVQFVPYSHGKALVSVGATGLFYSNDSGNSWKQLSTDASLYTIRFLNAQEAIAAGKDKIIRIRFE
ncbi:oxidoreductase [Flavobacterium sp.]